MTTKFNAQPVTAKMVRAEARQGGPRYANLSDAALVTIAEGARGRLHPDVRDAYNADRKPSEQYRETAPKTVQISYKHTTASGTRTKRVFIPETEARTLAGDKAGARGPLSKAALAAAGEAFAKAL